MISVAQLKHDLCIEQAESEEHLARAMRLHAAIELHPENTQPGAISLARYFQRSAESATVLAMEYRKEAAEHLAKVPGR